MSHEMNARRRFQFRLRTLMIGVTLLAVPMGYVGWQATIVRKRTSELDTLGKNCKIIFAPADARPRLPWIRRLLGDKDVAAINLPPTTIEEVYRVKEVFPEADVVGNLKLN
jgi:hypothetical protein